LKQFAIQEFSYVLPEVPHTGSDVVGQLHLSHSSFISVEEICEIISKKKN